MEALERAAGSSFAVINKHLAEVERLVQTKAGVATYYEQVRSGARQPDGDNWAALRHVVDELFFTGYKEKIVFGALSLDCVGVLNYGDWSLVLKTPMIANRSSTFEENTCVFAKRRNLGIADGETASLGFRATWAGRGKLAVAKLANAITSTTAPTDFSRIFLFQGPTSGDDRFIEVHILGGVTIRTVDKVVFTARLGAVRQASEARLLAISELLAVQKLALEYA